MIAAIVAAEIAFWVLLLGGLALRYIARLRGPSTVVLAAVPLVDVLLLTFVAIDIARGAPPRREHAFAAIYLGFTVAFGHSVIRWADAHFRHRFAGGPAPTKPPKGSTEEVRALWVEWFRVVLAAAIATVGIGAMILVEGRGIPSSIGELSHPYWATLHLLGVITIGWFLGGPAFAGKGTPAAQQSAQR